MPMDALTGSLALFAFPGDFDGWMECDGRVLAVKDNTALFSLLGTAYGGDGMTTFALPDLRGAVPVGVSPDRFGPYPLGAGGGASLVTLMAPEAPPHTHAFLGTSHPANASSIVNAIYANTAASPTAPALYGPAVNLQAIDPQTIGPAGGFMPHSNIQPSLGLSWKICVKGVYPARDGE
jgi:microcystin-dependent protein